MGCELLLGTHPRAAEMGQGCWKEPALLTDHLPLLHPNLREKTSRVRAEPEKRSKALLGQDLMRDT